MCFRLVAITAAVLFSSVGHAAGPSTVQESLEALKVAVGRGDRPSFTARVAWDQLVAHGPGAVPQILEAMDTPNTALANWLRTAFDRIVAADLEKGGKGLDADALLVFAQDTNHHGRTRRLALEAVDRLRPGTSGRLIPGWLEDSEFGPDAIDLLVEQADAHRKAGNTDTATTILRKAFAASRELPAAKATASRLRGLGVTVSVAEHLGFFDEWYVIGPFDARGMRGFKTVYPPEKQIDLNEEQEGKAGKVRWKHYRYSEPPAASFGHAGPLINLRDPLGDADDAVGYAYTAFRAPAATVVELRGAADDNLTVWVNGERVFGLEEYRNGVRFDRHRFRVELKAGLNTILVKVCQAQQAPDSPDANWEFLLRAVGASGKGVTWPSALPQKKE
jgi:hypothetical protein